ncbi:PilW family protein [Pseudomonas asuensis]
MSNSNNGIPSLWRIDYSNPDASSFEPEELVQGVQDMQIKYALGDDTGKITEDYVDAKDDLDWSRVVAVRVNLVSISHEKNIVPPGQEPQLNSAFKAIEDGRIGQVFSTTVGIRNRLP